MASFSNSSTSTQPFVEVEVNGEKRVEYRGNDEYQSVLTGRDSAVTLNATGREVFARYEYTGTRLGNRTGIQTGTTANSGSGYETIAVRQDGTTGAMGAGVSLLGSGDTFVGDRSLVIDAAARTVTLGSGDPVRIPNPAPATLTVADEHGGRLTLDTSGWTGMDVSTTVTGEASVSLGGGAFTSVDLTETDLRLRSGSSDTVMHVDTTALVRAGDELVTFSGTPNIFDTIRGAVADLRRSDSEGRDVIVERVQARLAELDRSQDDLLVGLGRLGSVSQRIDVAATRLEDLEITVEGLISNVEDADYADVALELQRAEQTLQLAQATGARLMQQTLLNFL